ncbi:MAG: proteasome assembly chaperone family protein [Candidatus Altiarchaeota archaeon]|nr:proteasome assembly chaperone family protein [Candidatus Altiarchaeota archaeon]
MEDRVGVIETGNVSEKANLILGIPDVGLVGPIAVTHIIEEMKLEELGYLDSELFPPIVVVHDHTPKSPIRFYGNKKLIAFISEMPLAPPLINPLSKALVDWCVDRRFNYVISIGGIARQDRVEIDTPEVYGLPSNGKMFDVLAEADIKVFEEGLLVGSYGAILRECMRKDVNSTYLMAESHLKYPDPGAAASVITALNKILDINVDVKSLKEKAEEIRIKARDLMKRTDNALQGMQKTQEQEIPMMYR